MPPETPRSEVTRKRIVYQAPGEAAVTIRRDVPYRVSNGDTLTLDVYLPPEPKRDAPAPAVVFVSGYPDPGLRKILGCKFKEMESYVSWGRVLAASGVAAVVYEAMHPAADAAAVIDHLRAQSTALGIDANRIGVWSCSGNVPTALAILMRPHEYRLECAVLCYGYMLDLGGSTAVAEAAATFRFANPCAGKSVGDLPPDLPLFIARAGRDEMPRLNETIDGFVVEALRLNLPLTLANHPTGSHAFDIADDSDASHKIVGQILAFLHYHLAWRG